MRGDLTPTVSRATACLDHEAIARSLNARPSEVVFTSGGTESDNLAVKGIYSARQVGDARRTRVLTTAVEHPAAKGFTGSRT